MDIFFPLNGSEDPETYQNETDPRIRSRIKMKRIRNTDPKGLYSVYTDISNFINFPCLRPWVLTSVGCEGRSRVAGGDAPDPLGRERRGCVALSCSNWKTKISLKSLNLDLHLILNVFPSFFFEAVRFGEKLACLKLKEKKTPVCSYSCPTKKHTLSKTWMHEKRTVQGNCWTLVLRSIENGLNVKA